MELIFIDETSDSKFKDYFGICCAQVNHTKYRNIKSKFHKILLDGGWDPNIEFKGSYLFSAKKGCESISVDDRVSLAEEILKLNSSESYGRMRFSYVRSSTDDFKKEYLGALPLLLDKVIKKPKKGQGKSLISINCDNRSDLCCDEVCNAIKPVIVRKGYTLVENVALVNSCFETVGILYADIMAYLLARIDVISNDHELFEGITPEMIKKSGKYKKLVSSKKLIGHIKNLDLYEVRH